MTQYFRPIPQVDAACPSEALVLAGGWCWFTHVEVLERGRASLIVPAHEAPQDMLERMLQPRPPVAGVRMDAPALMGILNVTPDSFSDGGLYHNLDAALSQADAMRAGGADILDIGGESTRPGADVVEIEEEIARTSPVIQAIRAQSSTPVSIDTRKAPVARAAQDAGADIINDVSALCFDPALAAVAAEAKMPICLMHAQGDPETMQDDPRYGDVLLDVYDFLEARITAAQNAGISRNQVITDPGIGFGKTLEHNIALIQRLSLFHTLGCPILLGASRKRFIGTIGQADQAHTRLGGSISVALEGRRHGVQITRVHDITQTKQAFRLADAL